MAEFEDRRVEEYIEREHPEFGKAEKAEAVRVAKAAYQGNVTLRDAGEAGANYIRDKRENG